MNTTELLPKNFAKSFLAVFLGNRDMKNKMHSRQNRCILGVIPAAVLNENNNK
jgi:hypothetical protein